MRKIILYIAQSLDGFIADKVGSVAFLDNFSDQELTDHDYHEFYSKIDTTLMGKNTYRQLLGFDVPFPYPDLKNYVFTNDRHKKKDTHVKYISENAASFMAGLKEKDGKNIWLVGGCALNTFCLEHHLIDEVWLFIVPMILGKGIPVFQHMPGDVIFKPKKVKNYPSRICLIRYDVETQNQNSD